MIRKLLPRPTATAENPHYKSGPPCKFYHLHAVKQLETSGKFRSLQAKRAHRLEQRATTPQRRRKAFDAKYVGNWPAALPLACQYMFNLNRYAKHRRCSPENRREIYELKNRLIRLLYVEGHATKVVRHSQTLPGKPAKICYSCDGAGCNRCDDSGEYLPALPPRTIEFVAFTFVVDGIAYSWHQPAESIDFNYTETEPDEDMPDIETERPVMLSSGKFSEAKALIVWILQRTKEK